MKRTLLTCGLIIALSLLTSAAHAATLASDNFESPTAPAALDNASGGSGWTANWDATGGASIVSKSLAPPLGPAGSLQAVLIDANSGNVMDRSFPAFSGGPLYVGFTIRGENLDTDNFISVQASDGATANGSQTLGVGFRNQVDNPFYARSGTSGSGQTTNAAQDLTDMTDFRIVAKFSQNGLEYETTELFINPMSFVEPLTPDAFATDTDPNMTQLSLFTVRSVGFGGDDALFIDDLIIADNFTAAAAVTPEPASIAVWSILGVLCLFGLGYRRMRGKHNA